MTYASVNGLQLYYEVHGSGRPIVLLHGGLLTIDLTFGSLLKPLAANRQVIAVELQGHGHTADTDRPMTIEALASDVIALLDQLETATLSRCSTSWRSPRPTFSASASAAWSRTRSRSARQTGSAR